MLLVCEITQVRFCLVRYSDISSGLKYDTII